MKLNFTDQTVAFAATLSFKQMGVLEKVLNEAVDLNGDNFDDVSEISAIATMFGLTVNLPSDKDADEGNEPEYTSEVDEVEE